jgi:hypothetical protein
MAIDRRSLLAGIASAVLLRAGAASGGQSPALFIACRADAAGGASVAMFSADGAELFATELPARGHDIAVRPGARDAVVFSRRPGNWFTVIDLADRRVVATVLAKANRHFCGHGAFAAAGQLLIATENDIATGHGKLGIYDATAGYRRIGEFSSHGTGPHDIALLPDGRRLVVANGGLRTDPASGRETPDLAGMRPSLAVVDARDGTLLGRSTLDPCLNGLSIRHLTVSPEGSVCFGFSMKGIPLICRHWSVRSAPAAACGSLRCPMKTWCHSTIT